MASPRLLLRSLLLRSLLVSMVDPAQLYLDRHRRALPRGGGPGPRRTPPADDGAAPGDAEPDGAPLLRRAAHDLLAAGATAFRVGDRRVEARMIRFWRGHHLPVTATHGPHGGGASLSRIGRDRTGEEVEVPVGYLARAAGKGRSPLP
jgi:hypothetical protein